MELFKIMDSLPKKPIEFDWIGWSYLMKYLLKRMNDENLKNITYNEFLKSHLAGAITIKYGIDYNVLYKRLEEYKI